MINVHNSGFINFSASAIRKVMDLEGALYLDDYAWDGDQVWSLFYTAVLRKPEHAHYWGIRRTLHLPEVGINGGNVIIRSFADKQPFWFGGVYHAATNAFVYSRSQHDFYRPEGVPFAIDGGPAYTRIVGNIDFANDIVNAEFNPMTMEVRSAGVIIGQGQFVSTDRRNLRR